MRGKLYYVPDDLKISVFVFGHHEINCICIWQSVFALIPECDDYLSGPMMSLFLSLCLRPDPRGRPGFLFTCGNVECLDEGSVS